MNLTMIRGLFALAAVYDGVLGLAFLVAPHWVFSQFQITPPGHLGYVQFPAALLVVFGLMFLNIARHPVKNAGLILYGMLLKVAYCSVTFSYWFTSGNISRIWKPFAIADLVMLILFAIAWRTLSSPQPATK